MARSRTMQVERTLSMATRFLEEIRSDIGRTALDGMDTPPRLRAIHERQGHATPEFRTLAIPMPDGAAGASPEILSGAIARYAASKQPDCLILAFEAEMEAGPVLIAEARDRAGTRLFWMQPYTVQATHVEWGEPLHDGWQDPGGEEMILDAAFRRIPAAGDGDGARRPRTHARAAP
ncbi:MAG TPA: hypothetical protein VFX98_12635 [Longimicrobiaceae bacterium]|nr:hypothetical protein [Longimicrobiaceae bacterium]